MRNRLHRSIAIGALCCALAGCSGAPDIVVRSQVVACPKSPPIATCGIPWSQSQGQTLRTLLAYVYSAEFHIQQCEAELQAWREAYRACGEMNEDFKDQ